MKKRSISILLVLVMVFALLPQVAMTASAETYSGACGENLTWTLDTETGVLSISGTGEMMDCYDGTAPWRPYLDAITSVVISDGVTTIGEEAFAGCTGLTSVTIPESVSAICGNTFAGCTGLTEITLPAGVKEIANEAFLGCTSLTSVTIPASVIWIGTKAFYGCTSLASVMIPESLRLIDFKAFGFYDGEAGDTILEGFVVIGYEGTYAEGYAFQYGLTFESIGAPPTAGTCGENLTWSLNAETGALTIAGSGKMADYEDIMGWSSAPWYNYNDAVTSVEIADGVTTIGNNAFCGCEYMTSVTIPESVSSIGERAFEYCRKLSAVTIPESVTSIGMGAFGQCSRLTKVTVPAGVTSIEDCVFDGCSRLSSVTIPESVTEIGWSAFHGCKKLTEITIPESVVLIGNSAFSGCTSLKSVTIPKNVALVEDSAFYGCASLESVTISDGVRSINQMAFFGCSSLENVMLPASLTSIEVGAFAYCANLQAIIVDPENPAYASDKSGVLFNKDKTVLITCPGGKSGRYEIPAGTVEIRELAFHTCNNLTSLIIPESVVSINTAAFITCGGMEQIAVLNPNSRLYMDGFGLDEIFPSSTVFYCHRGSEVAIYAEMAGYEVKYFFEDTTFVDVKASNYYADAVLWAVHHDPKITAGTDTLHFTPKMNCAREQVVTFLWAANGCPEPKSDSTPFRDVKKNSWFRQAVLWAAEQGITGGVDETHFGVGQSCDRAQVVTFLWAAKGKPAPTTTDNPFTDVKKQAYYYDAVLWAAENGVTGGTTATTFSPKTSCDRAQVMTFLYALYGEKN